ncbi:MAG: hypothetical protein ACRD5J_11600 [Nitrososphaeraceae archaeon]
MSKIEVIIYSSSVLGANHVGYQSHDTNKADPNTKTITTSAVQGRTRTITTRLRQVRKLTPEEELDRVLRLGS